LAVAVLTLPGDIRLCVPPARDRERRTPRRGAPGRGHHPVRTPGRWNGSEHLRGPPALAGPSVTMRGAHGNSRRSLAWPKNTRPRSFPRPEPARSSGRSARANGTAPPADRPEALSGFQGVAPWA